MIKTHRKSKAAKVGFSIQHDAIRILKHMQLT